MRKVRFSKNRWAALLVVIVAAGFCSCDRLDTELTSSCHEITTSIDQNSIKWERAESQASINEVVVECFTIKDASSYNLVATAKVSTKIDDVLFRLNGPLTDAIRFEALSAKGVVIAHEKIPYAVPRLLRTENVSARFKDLSASEIKSVTKVVVGWAFE